MTDSFFTLHDPVIYVCIGLSVVIFLCLMFLPIASFGEKSVTYDVALKDGTKATVTALENYQVTRAGALCFWDRRGNLSVCFSPGEWTKIEVAK